MLRETTNASTCGSGNEDASSVGAKSARCNRGGGGNGEKIEGEEERKNEDETMLEKFENDVCDEVVLDWFTATGSFDGVRAESERGAGCALDELYQTPIKQMSKQELLDEKAELKKRLRAFDARVLKLHNKVASKADKRHVRPLYARLSKVKEGLEIQEGMRSRPNLAVASIRI